MESQITHVIVKQSATKYHSYSPIERRGGPLRHRVRPPKPVAQHSLYQVRSFSSS